MSSLLFFLFALLPVPPSGGLVRRRGLVHLPRDRAVVISSPGCSGSEALQAAQANDAGVDTIPAVLVTVGRSVGRSVGRPVGRSVGRSVVLRFPMVLNTCQISDVPPLSKCYVSLWF